MNFLVPTFHPAFIGRNNARFNGVVLHDLKKAVQLEQGWRPQWTDAGSIYEPDVCQVEKVLRSMHSKRVAYDIETDGRHPLFCDVRCIALFDGRQAICIPFLYRDGTTQQVLVEGQKKPVTKKVWKPAYAGKKLGRVLAALQKLFNSGVEDTKDYAGTRLETQNGQYDRLCLKARFGLTAPYAWGRHVDTILAHHIVAGYLPHDLGFLATLYTDAPYYKATEGGDSWASESDRELWLYCLRGDVPVVMADGTRRRVEDLVHAKSTSEVLSYNEKTKKMEPRQIVGWHQNRVAGQRWVQLRTGVRRGIVLTPDHTVLVEGRGWCRADSVHLGDYLILPEEELNEDRRHALMGTLLGDSTISVAPYARGSLASVKVAVRGTHQTTSQLTQEKVRLLGPYAATGYGTEGGPLKISGRDGIGTPALSWSTRTLHQLSSLRTRLHPGGSKKRLPLDFVQEMGPVGWAWWFMDDGCVQRGQLKKQNTGARGGRKYAKDSVCLATQGFPRLDVLTVAQWMRQVFGATTVGRDNVIRLGVSASAKFCGQIAPFIFPAQRYKLPRETEWSPYRDFDTAETNRPVRVAVIEAKEWKPPTNTKEQRYRAETRFCLDVEGNHNFFTPQGLVHNCCRDVRVTYAVATKLREELKERQEDLRLYQHDAWQESQCQQWRETGVEVDLEALDYFRWFYVGARDAALMALKKIVEQRVVGNVKKGSALEALLTRISTPDVTEDEVDALTDDGTGKTAEKFNPASLIQLRLMLAELGVPLTEKTATGELSTAKEFLQSARKELLELGAKAEDDRLAFLDYLDAWRKASKIFGTYLDPEVMEAGYLTAQGTKAVRLHPGFSVHVVPTGRLASKSPNFQNLPAIIRGMFVARPGHVLVMIDWDALEMRLGAFLSQDPTFLADLAAWDARTGPKVHVLNMCNIFGLELVKGVEDKYPGCYRAAKVFAYSCLEKSTKVALLSGKKSISQCKVGDWTWCWDGHQLVSTRIKAVINKGVQECYRVTAIDGLGKRKKLVVTGTHPMMMRDGTYQRVTELCEGDLLMPFQWPHHVVESVEKIPRLHEVWDISVDHPAQNFALADFGTMVHNTAYGAGAQTVYEQVRAEMPEMQWAPFLECYERYKKFRKVLFAFQAQVVLLGTQNQHLDSGILKRRGWFWERGFGENSPESSRMQNFPYQCITRHMRVLTSKGYLPIGELRGKIKAWTGRKFAPAKVVKKGLASLFRVHFANGIQIDVDATHHFLVDDGARHCWVKVPFLNGCRIALDLAHPQEGGEKGPEDIAHLAGFYLGNGSTNEVEGSVTLIVGDSEVRAEHRRAQNLLPVLLATLRGHGYQARALDARGCTRVAIFGKAGKRLTAQMGTTPKQKAATKQVPKWIWSSSLACRVAFLRGLLDADGCIGTDKEVRLHLCQRELLQEVWLLARTCGVTGSIYGPFTADRKGHQSWVLVLNASQSARHLRWGIEGAQLRSGQLTPTWVAREALSGLKFKRSTSHQVLASRVKQGGSTSPYTVEVMGGQHSELYDYTFVEHVESLNIAEPVYTLMVDDVQHRYVAEGSIARNSTGADVVSLANRRVVDCLVAPWQKKLRPHEVLHQLGQIHDELLFEVPERLAESFNKALVRISREPATSAQASWNLPVDSKIQRRWKKVQMKCGGEVKGKKSVCREAVVIEPTMRLATSIIWGGTCAKCGNKVKLEVPRSKSALHVSLDSAPCNRQSDAPL